MGVSEHLALAVSPRGRALTRYFESLRLTAYPDTKGRWAIGYGMTGPDVCQGKTITRAEAEQACDARLDSIADSLNLNLVPSVTQGMFDALADVAYNHGLTELYGSTLWDCMQAGWFAGAAIELPKWIHGTDKTGQRVVLGWQVKRRRADLEMFQTGDWTIPAKT